MSERRVQRSRLRRFFRKPALWGSIVLASGVGALTHSTMGCNGWDPADPFSHNSPEVERALAAMDAGDLRSAEKVLGDYLGTGVCQGSKIGIPETVKQKPDGTFDLGIILFYLGERYGRKFGDEEKGDPAKPDEPAEVQRRKEEIDCALLVLQAIKNDPSVPIELRARASYLAGNLEFLRRQYPDAVRMYDEALRLIPGVVEEAGGDSIGRDTAWNRAIALRRIEDQKNDAGTDGADGNDGSDGDDGSDGADGADGNDGDDAGDGAPDAPDGDAGGGDAGDGGDGGQDAGDAAPGDDAGDAGDGGMDAGDGGDGGMDAGPDADTDAGQSPREPNDQPPKNLPQQDDEGTEQQQDDQLLDDADHGTQTYQQKEAQRLGGKRRNMEDK